MSDLGVALRATPMPVTMSSASNVLITPSWATGCMQLYGDTNTYGLVNYLGQSLDTRNASWGITLEACNEFCGNDKLQIVRIVLTIRVTAIRLLFFLLLH